LGGDDDFLSVIVLPHLMQVWIYVVADAAEKAGANMRRAKRRTAKKFLKISIVTEHSGDLAA